MTHKKTLRTLAIAAVSANALGCGLAPTQTFRELPTSQSGETAGTLTFHHENVLGTSLELKLRYTHAAHSVQAEAAALAEIDRCEKILSAWRPDSEFSRWASTRGTAEKISAELMDVLFLFDAWREQTDGALDASAEAATKLWQLAALRNRPPSPDERAAVVKTMQVPHWRLDRVAGTAVHLDDSPLALNSFARAVGVGRTAWAK